jgi:hypothetical protein
MELTQNHVQLWTLVLTFRHHASYIQDRCSAALQRMIFIYLINKYISLYFLDLLNNVNLFLYKISRIS